MTTKKTIKDNKTNRRRIKRVVYVLLNLLLVIIFFGSFKEVIVLRKAQDNPQMVSVTVKRCSDDIYLSPGRGHGIIENYCYVTEKNSSKEVIVHTGNKLYNPRDEIKVYKVSGLGSEYLQQDLDYNGRLGNVYLAAFGLMFINFLSVSDYLRKRNRKKNRISTLDV